METEANAVQWKKEENVSHESVKNLDNTCVVIEAKDVVELSPPLMVPANGGASIRPMTPDSGRENGEVPFAAASPITLVASPSTQSGFDSHQKDDPCSSSEDSPRTPKEGVFDPFAPGPDKLMLAPHRKHNQESRVSVARRLNFNSTLKIVGDAKCEIDAEMISDEDILLETVYVTLLEAIVSKQSEMVLRELLPLDPSPDGFKTPTSTPCLNGTDELRAGQIGVHKIREASVNSRIDSSPDGYETPTSAPRLRVIAEICPGAPTFNSAEFMIRHLTTGYGTCTCTLPLGPSPQEIIQHLVDA
ncbi:hypothetical protein RJ639_002764 [Escallonia herrerae]|uniref:Uncharacterized protein n=1 Tax=Escallonia herrerae TaxID=1293975 RepID=A0AA88W7S9_9ASTE|nr:hypothetical protein RJ639_002764 [Escallonia herrerae]